MKLSENRIQSIKLFRKVVSLKNVYINKSHWLCTFPVEISDTSMEEPLQIYSTNKS